MNRICLVRWELVVALAASLVPQSASAVYYEDCAFNTGVNASVIVQGGTVYLDDAEIHTGVEIAVFTSDGVCAGVGTWSEQALAITVWGNDVLTADKDGFVVGEPLSFRAFAPDSGLEYNAVLEAVVSDEKPHYTPHVFFVEHGIYVLKRLELESSTPEEDRGKSVSTEKQVPFDGPVSMTQNYPNPFNPSTTIAYTLRESADVRVRVLNTLGQMLLDTFEGHRSAGMHQVSIRLDGMPSGLYLYQILASDRMVTRTMLLAK